MLEEWVEVYFKSLARYLIVGVCENHVTSLFSSCPYSNRVLAGVRAYPHIILLFRQKLLMDLHVKIPNVVVDWLNTSSHLRDLWFKSWLGDRLP
jgi:hypothetical protein